MAVAAYGVGDSLVLPRSGLLTGHPEAAAVVAGSLGVLVLWRRRWPLTVTWIVLVGHVVSYAPAALIAALYTVGTVYWSRRGVLALVAVLGLVAQLWSSQAGGRGLDFVHSIAFVAFPLLLGLFAATRLELIRTAQERAAALQDEQVLTIARVRADERLELARELHDLVAHHISGIVVQAKAARYVAADAQRVERVLDQIGRAGDEALEAMHRLVHVLRHTEPVTAPVAGLEQVRELVDAFSRAGPPAVLDLDSALAGRVPHGWGRGSTGSCARP